MKAGLTLAVAVGVLCLVSGCGGPSAAAPGSSVSSTSAAPSSAGRPESVDLNGRDPCTLLTSGQFPAFDITLPGQSDVNATFGNARECLYSTDVAFLLRVMLVTDEGISAWTTGQRNAVVRRTTLVLGFPAITTTIPGNADPGGCSTLVDVASGQYLDATVEITQGRESKVPSPCTYAHQLAEAAMTTLLHGG